MILCSRNSFNPNVMAAAICRLCLGEAEHPHYTSLFGRKSLEKDLPSRVSKLSGISMSKQSGYPERLCRGCMGKFHSLEENLDKFKERAMASYRVYSRKRPTESRQSPSTPTTERSRPPAKRTRARCLFPDDPTASVLYISNPTIINIIRSRCS